MLNKSHVPQLISSHIIPGKARRRVGIFSKADNFGGGASRVARDLTELLHENGVVAQHFARWWSDESYSLVDSLYGSRFRWITARLHDLATKLGFPESIPFELPYLLGKRIFQRFDVLHFHDISSAISPLTVWLASKIRPTVWTFHDCSPFTAGCLYPHGCQAFRSGCRSCPQVGEWPINSLVDNSRLWAFIKRITHTSSSLTCVAPSNWMAEMARSSRMVSKTPIVIPNGVDASIFRPQDKGSLKRKFGIPEDRTVYLLSAGSFLDERKGNRYAIEALRYLEGRKPFLLVVGSVNDQAVRFLDGFDCLVTGYIGNSSELADYYAAADAFLFCSLADNMPLTVLESMACGTPVIGFRTGGIPEMITSGEEGFLVPQRDVRGLIQILRDSKKNDLLSTWGVQARERVLNSFTHEIFINRHMNLYDRVLSDSSLPIGSETVTL